MSGGPPLVFLAAAGPASKASTMPGPIRDSAPLSLPLSWACWPVAVRGTIVDRVGPDRQLAVVICEKGGWMLVANLLFLWFVGHPMSDSCSQRKQSYWWTPVSHCFRADHVEAAEPSLTRMLIVDSDSHVLNEFFLVCGSVPLTRMQDLETRVDASTCSAVHVS